MQPCKKPKQEQELGDVKLLFLLEMTECSSGQFQFQLADVKLNHSRFIFESEEKELRFQWNMSHSSREHPTCCLLLVPI